MRRLLLTAAGTVTAMAVLRRPDVWLKVYPQTQYSFNVIGTMLHTTPYGVAGSLAVGPWGVAGGWHFREPHKLPDATWEFGLVGADVDSPG